MQRSQDHDRGNRDQRGQSCHRKAQSRIVRAEIGETEARVIRAGVTKSRVCRTLEEILDSGQGRFPIQETTAKLDLEG